MAHLFPSLRRWGGLHRTITWSVERRGRKAQGLRRVDAAGERWRSALRVFVAGQRRLTVRGIAIRLLSCRSF